MKSSNPSDSRWRAPYISKPEEKEDIKALKKRLIVSDFEDTFRLIEARDFIDENRRNIGTLNTLKNYYQGARRAVAQHRSLLPTPQRRALEHVNNTIHYNPKYARVMGISMEAGDKALEGRHRNNHSMVAGSVRQLSPIEREKAVLKQHIDKIRTLIVKNPYR